MTEPDFSRPSVLLTDGGGSIRDFPAAIMRNIRANLVILAIDGIDMEGIETGLNSRVPVLSDRWKPRSDACRSRVESGVES